MEHVDIQYLDLVRKILDHGERRENRTGVDTIGIWGHMLKIDLQQGFPLLTTKKMAWKAMTVELIGFINGVTDVKWYQDRKCNIWNEWATEAYARDRLKLQPGEPGYEEGDLGPIYGWQWRFAGAKYTGKFNPDLLNSSEEMQQRYVDYKTFGTDQLRWVVDQLIDNPNSRQTVLNSWSAPHLRYQALPPCHVMAQFEVRDGKLCCAMTQRSCDVFLGVPFNIAQYALLTHLLAHLCRLEVGTFVHYLNDAHIYENHIEQMKEQLTREPKQLPTLVIDQTIEGLADLRIDIVDGKPELPVYMSGYDPHPKLTGEVAV